MSAAALLSNSIVLPKTKGPSDVTVGVIPTLNSARKCLNPAFKWCEVVFLRISAENSFRKIESLEMDCATLEKILNSLTLGTFLI